MARPAPTFRDIMSAIAKKRFAPVYILMGDEPYYIDRITSALEQNVVEEADRDFNTFTFYGAEAEIDTVIASAQQLPMMAERQLVLLKEAQAMPRAKTTLEKLQGYMSHVNPASVLVIVYKAEPLPSTSKMLKAAAASGAVIFKSTRLRDYQIANPLKDYCAEKKVKIDDAAIAMLGEFVGSSLESLFSAIDKIIIAKGEGASQILPADVVQNVGMSKEYNPFELTSAIGKRNFKKAQTIVRYFRDNPKQAPTVMITATLFNYFARIVLAHSAASANDAAIAAACGAKSPYQLREVKTAMRNFSFASSVNAISAIRRFDAASKGIDSMQNEHELLRELIFKLFTC